MKKTLFAIATFLVAAIGVAQGAVTPRSPRILAGQTAELIITNNLTEKHADGSWYLTAAAKQWVKYESDQAPMVQQTNRANVWYDIYSDVDTMIVTSEEKNWGGYFTVKSREGATAGLIVVGKSRMPHFFIKDTKEIRLFFSGSASKTGKPELVVIDMATNEVVEDIVSDMELSKSTWDKSVMLSAKLDISKSYEIIAKTAGNQNDLVLQALRLYGNETPLSSEITEGAELSSYIAAYRAANPDADKFTLQPGAWYTISAPIVADCGIQILGDAISPATIDASELDGPFIQMSDKPAVAADSKGLIVLEDNIQLSNIKVKNLKAPLLSTNRQKYIFPLVELSNSVIELAGGEQSVFDCFGGGAIGKLAINKSTIYAKGEHTGYLYNAQAGSILIQAGLKEQVFSITNSTLKGIAYNKHIINHRMRSQIWQTYEVKNNIIFDSGRPGRFCMGMNGGVLHAYPKWVIEGNSFLWTETKKEKKDGKTVYTEYIVDNGKEESTGDNFEPVKNSIVGITKLKDFANGDLTIEESSMQAKFQVGDPRWLVPYATPAVAFEAAGDFVAQLNGELKKSEMPKSITITFPAGSYETSGEIKTDAPVNFVAADGAEVILKATKPMTLGGAFSIKGITIDASALEKPFVTLAGNKYLLQDNGFYSIGNISFNNVKVTGLKQDLVYGNKVKNLIPKLDFVGSKVFMAAEKKTVFNFNGGGVVETLNIENSTIDAAKSYIFSSQSGQKATEAGLEQQSFIIQNSTIHNPNSNSFQHRQNGQTWLRYVLKNSIISEPGRDNFVADMNKGQQSPNPVWEIDHNSFQKTIDGVLTDIADKQNTGDEAEPVQNSVIGVTDFEDPEVGDFTVDCSSVQALEKLGDPSFLVPFMQKVPFDMTAKVGVSQGDWHAGGVCATQYAPAVTTSDGRTSNMMEKYEGNVATTGELMYQEVKDLPNGKYTVTLFANAFYTDGRGFESDLEDGATDVAYVFANNKKAYVTAHIATATAENGEYTIANVKVKDGVLKLGYGKDKAGTNWHTIQIKSLIFQKPMDEAYAEVKPEAEELAAKKMANATKAALDEALAAEESVDNYTALVAAIKAAKTSVASYEIIEAGTVADNSMANWTCTNTNAFHINTWSVEGNEGNDPSGMVTPFIENWVGKPGPLGVGEETYTLAGLNPGEKYQVTALVRAYSESGEDVAGGSFFVGNNKVDLATGTAFEYNGMKGIYGKFTAEGVVAEDGTFKFGVAHENPTYNWVAIKNITIDPIYPAPGILIAEKDWTKETKYPYYNMGAPEGASYDVKDGALVVTNTVKQNDIWGLQLFALDWFNLQEGKDYVVRFYAKIPADGQVQVNMGTWVGNTQQIIDVKATNKFKPIDVTFEKFPYSNSGNDAHVLWQQGWLLGTAEISKVQVFELLKEDPDELIVNGHCELEDGGCLVTKNGEDGGAFKWNVKEGAGVDGSKCAVVHSVDNAAQEWDSQFFIYEKKHVFAAGEKFRISFMIKADKDAEVDLQAHSTPGNYIGWYVDGFSGPLKVTTEWQEVVIEGTITDHEDWGAKMTGMQTLAFNLNKDKTLENNYYFDNVSWKLVPDIHQGNVTYAIQVDETHASGDAVEVKNENEVVATLTFGEEGGAEFGAGKADGSVEGYVAMTAGNGQNGNKAGGTWYIIAPKYDGVIAAAVSLNSGKKFHLTVDGEQNPVFDNNTVDEKYNGIIEFNVVGGKTYKFYCDGSKLGFYGFNYAYGPDVQPIEEKSVAEQIAAKAHTRTVMGIDAIETESDDDVMYNLRGQRITAPVKGQIYIKNGKKHVAK